MCSRRASIALDHFNTFGFHEGRDPNSFFDTSGYLAVNKDVAAAGVNPLDHFHQFGWKRGARSVRRLRHHALSASTIRTWRRPASIRSSTFFSSASPKAAQAFAAIGQNIVGGFDAQFYLFHNPDVAAAGVDPLFHYNVVGRHEGRNPNAWFDTAGYLSHYTDVAAAGINPLQHYETVGWTEGRDPSAGFDTLGYLAANPDVAAAQYQPARSLPAVRHLRGPGVVNDGVFH